MNFKQLKVFLEKRITELEELAEKTNKRTVLVIQQFPSDLDKEILVPNIRESISNIIAFVELGDIKSLEYVIKRSDGIFDAIVADIDQKSSFSKHFIEIINKGVRKSLLFYYNDNAVWVDSALNYIQNIEKSLYGRHVLLCGDGYLFSQLLLRLIDYGALVYISSPFNNEIWTSTGNKIKILTDCILPLKSKKDIENLDFIIGASVKKESLQEVVVENLKNSINMYDIGIGNFSEKVIRIAELKSSKIFRLDNRAGISGLLISLFETNYLITEMMGKVYINGIEIISGGVLGKNGAIIVDNVKNPSYVIGIADGKGKVKPIPENMTEENNLKFVNKLINKV